MKKDPMKKIKKKFQKSKIKGNLIMEMADDFMDLIKKAKVYKKINKKK